MEEIVTGVMGLVTGALGYGIDNALALAIGALLGSQLASAGLGLVSDMLGRAKGLVEGVTSMLSKK